MKRIRLILCSVMLFCIANLCCTTAMAANQIPPNYDPNTVCTLNITLAVPSAPPIPVSGAEIVIYRVADISVSDSKISYTYCEDFEDCDAWLSPYSIYDEDTAEEVYQYALQNGVKGVTAVTDEAGKITFEGLKTCIYLCTETSSPEGYLPFSPFLISIPEAAGNVWDYNVVAEPKIEATRFMDVSVVKKWNDDAGKRRPQTIDVQLYKGSVLCDTVTLSGTNDWKYTWQALPYGDDYSVKEAEVPSGYTVTYSGQKFEFTIVNTENLIQTGQLKWPIPILASGGLILIVGGFAIRGSGRKQKDGK